MAQALKIFEALPRELRDTFAALRDWIRPRTRVRKEKNTAPSSASTELDDDSDDDEVIADAEVPTEPLRPRVIDFFFAYTYLCAEDERLEAEIRKMESQNLVLAQTAWYF